MFIKVLLAPETGLSEKGFLLAYPCMIIHIANFSDWKFEEHIYRPAVGWKYPNIYRISNLLNLFNILYF